MKWREHCERRHKRELEYKQFLEKQKEKQKQKEFDLFDDVRNPESPLFDPLFCLKNGLSYKQPDKQTDKPKNKRKYMTNSIGPQ